MQETTSRSGPSPRPGEARTRRPREHGNATSTVRPSPRSRPSGARPGYTSTHRSPDKARMRRLREHGDVTSTMQPSPRSRPFGPRPGYAGRYPEKRRTPRLRDDACDERATIERSAIPRRHSVDLRPRDTRRSPDERRLPRLRGDACDEPSTIDRSADPRSRPLGPRPGYAGPTTPTQHSRATISRRVPGRPPAWPSR